MGDRHSSDSRPRAARRLLVSTVLLLSLGGRACPPAAAQAPRAVERALARAEAESNAGRVTRALAWTRKAARFSPHEPRVVALLIALRLGPRPFPAHVEVDALDEIGRACGDAVDLPPGLARDCAVVHARAHDLRRAFGILERITSAYDPESAAAWAEVGRGLVLGGELQAADRALSRAYAAMPELATYALELADVRILRGRPDEAVALLRPVVASAGAPAPALRRLAVALLADGRTDESVRVARAYVARCDDSTRVVCLADLAEVALQAGIIHEAERAAEEASAGACPEDARPFVLLGLARIQAGDPSGARLALEEALRRTPGDVIARAALESLRNGPGLAPP